MASRDRKEEKAEGAARYAADEIKSAREERQSQQQQQLHRDYDVTPRGTTTTTFEEHDYERNSTNRPGLISSVVGAIGSTYEHAKEAVTGKTHDAAEKTKEAAEATSQSMQQSHDAAAVRAREKAELAREGRDNTAERLRQTKDSAVDTAVSAKDKTVGATKDAAGYVADTAVSAKDKTVGATKDAAGYVADTAVSAKDKTVGATKDAAGYVGDKTRDAAGYAADTAVSAKDKTVDAAGYTAEKAKEGKDTTVGKLGELKDRAMGYFTVKKDETKEKVGETAQALKDKTYEAKEEAKDTFKGVEDEARRKMEERRIENLKDKGYNTVVDEDALRGEAGKNNTIFGAIGNVAEAVKSKLTMQGETVEGGRQLEHGREGREVTVTVEESHPGAAAEILKDVNKTGAGRKGGVGVGEVAELLKDADQITGQSFSPNDVGRMDDERRRR